MALKCNSIHFTAASDSMQMNKRPKKRATDQKEKRKKAEKNIKMWRKFHKNGQIQKYLFEPVRLTERPIANSVIWSLNWMENVAGRVKFLIILVSCKNIQKQTRFIWIYKKDSVKCKMSPVWIQYMTCEMQSYENVQWDY